MANTLISLATSIETQGVHSIIGGFSFASALAWYGVVQAIIAKYVKTGPTIQAHVIAALVTTLFSILVFMLLKFVARNIKVEEPSQPVYAITR